MWLTRARTSYSGHGVGAPNCSGLTAETSAWSLVSTLASTSTSLTMSPPVRQRPAQARPLTTSWVASNHSAAPWVPRPVRPGLAVAPDERSDAGPPTSAETCPLPHRHADGDETEFGGVLPERYRTRILTLLSLSWRLRRHSPATGREGSPAPRPRTLSRPSSGN